MRSVERERERGVSKSAVSPVTHRQQHTCTHIHTYVDTHIPARRSLIDIVIWKVDRTELRIFTML